MSDKPHMTAEQVDDLIAGLVSRKVRMFKVSHCLKVGDRILCLDINQWFQTVPEILSALQTYCREHGRDGFMNAAPPEWWKRFVAAPRPIPAPEIVRIPQAFNTVLVVVRTEVS